MRNNNKKNKEKLLFTVLPYWTPLIPPLGIACLKSHLKKLGYDVKTIDANTRNEFMNIYNCYFSTLKSYVPKNCRGNFYNIGNDVFHNHMMAHLNYFEKKPYYKLINIIVEKTFYCSLSNDQIENLVKILDEFYDELKVYFINVLTQEKPNILGLSVYKGTLAASLFVAKLAKEINPNIKVIMGGGIYADQLAIDSPNLEYFLKRTEKYIDKLMIGEGEILFEKYLEGELDDNKRVYTFRDIQDEIADIEKLDIPDFTDFDISSYSQLASYVSRSCPFQCKFCSETVQWGKYRKKSALKIVRELEKLYKMYGSQLYLMGDSLLNPVISNLSNEFIKSSSTIYWDGYLRADKNASMENVLKWRKGGFYRARIGVESGSDKVLKLMGKKIDTELIKKTIKNLAAVGIKTTTYWIIGYPGETEQDFQQTLNLIEELKDDIWEAECNPFGYYLSGQSNSDEWAEQASLLYPEDAKQMLIVQSWIMDCEPNRREIYKRVNRFVNHCRRLGIPNPYFLQDIFNADQRWKELHKNAVPSLIQFKDNYLDECKEINLYKA